MYNKLYNLLIEGLSGASKAALNTYRQHKKLRPTLNSIDFNTSPAYQPDAVDAVRKSNQLRDKFTKQAQAIPTKKTRNKDRIKRVLKNTPKRYNRKNNVFKDERDRASRQIKKLRNKKAIDEGTTTGGDPTFTAIRMGRAERKNNLRDYSDKRVNKIAAKVTKKHSKHLPKGIRSKAAKEIYNRFIDAYYRSNNFETWQLKT